MSNWLILAIIWLVGALGDRLWFNLDNSVPAWDQADYLNGVLDYWQALQTPQWFDGNWWRSFWLLSNKIPPLTYIITSPFIHLFGTSADAATLVMLLFSGILLVSVYGLGVILFNNSVGLWAAAICQLLPGLYRYRLDFLLDYPLTTVVTLSFFSLTLWHFTNSKSILKAAFFGMTLGIALMVKQTALFFLFLPLLWLTGGILKNRKWSRLGQLFGAFSVSLLIFYPWYRTNWLLIFTSGKRATIDSAIAEGDPALNTLHAWTYYLKILPYLVSWPLLLVPIVGLLLYFGRKWWKTGNLSIEPFSGVKLRWILIFLIGGYFLSSLNINKDHRYILPLLPVLSLVLAWGLISYQQRWKNYLTIGTLAISYVLMLFNLFPLGGEALTNLFSPYMQHYANMGKKWPNQYVVKTIQETSPYLRATLGVLPSTPEINQHNFSYFGGQNGFQVYGRQVGVREKEVQQDARSLDWFVTKNGDQGSVPEAQKTIVNIVSKGGDFYLVEDWHLPDKSVLNLYHRLSPTIEVKPISQIGENLKLSVILPEKAPHGSTIPVTYQWSGSWSELESGIVLLNWEHIDLPQRWLHDHAIAMGSLHQGNLKPEELKGNFQVTEKLGMYIPGDVEVGKYFLRATYLNRKTKQTYAIPVDNISIIIDPKATTTAAPELDLVSQLRLIAPNLSQGITGLDPIFAQTARVNQYDPIQDYLLQADIALSNRLKNDQSAPERVNWAYTIALARVLRQDVEGAIAALKQVVELDGRNPYSHAYLAFVYLYDWRGSEAEKALLKALEINRELPVLQALRGIAALMQGHLFQAIQDLSNSLGRI